MLEIDQSISIDCVRPFAAKKTFVIKTAAIDGKNFVRYLRVTFNFEFRNVRRASLHASCGRLNCILSVLYFILSVWFAPSFVCISLGRIEFNSFDKLKLCVCVCVCVGDANESDAALMMSNNEVSPKED